MNRADWLRRIRDLPAPRTDEESDAFVEALLCVAATAYAAHYKVGSGSLQELANAAYHAMQDKADEIMTRN